MIVDIFIPCYIDQFSPDTASNMVRVLEKIGCSVNYNIEQTCCGQPAYAAGFWDECKEVGEKFIADFHTERYLVSPSTLCVGMIKNHYTELFHNSSLHNEFKQIKKQIHELSDFLVNEIKITDIGAKLPGRAVYLDTCHGLRECGIKAEPRILLSKIRGLQLIEIADQETCCGFGGRFSTQFQALGQQMAEDKLKQIKSIHPDYIIASDLTCLLHLENYQESLGYQVQIMHLADALASGW